jgi:hypothetical protein
MRNNVIIGCARVGLAALASLGMLAGPGAPASAAPSAQTALARTASVAALTPAECAAIRQQIGVLEAREEAAQERLSEAPPAQKPALIKLIKKLGAQIAALQAQLAAGCPA